MAASLIDLIRGQNLAQLKQAEQNPEILQNFEENCLAMEEDGQIEDRSLDKDFGEKLELLLTLYKEKNPLLFNRLCSVAKKFWFETPKFNELRTVMSAQISRMERIAFTGFVSRLFTPDQEDLSNKVETALAQLDTFYTPSIPQNIIESLREFNRAILTIVNDRSMPLSEKLDHIATLYDGYHAQLSAEIEAALYPSRAAGEACSIESIPLNIDDLRTLKAHIEKFYPDQQESIRAEVVQSYLCMCFHYINKRLGYELAGNEHEDTLQYLINVIPNILMQNRKINVRDRIISRVVLRLDTTLDEHKGELRKKRQQLGKLVEGQEKKYGSIREKLGSKTENMPVCIEAIEEIHKKSKPSFTDKFSAPFKSKKSDSSDQAIIKWATETEEFINKAKALQNDIEHLKRTIEPSASEASVSIPQHSAPARIAPVMPSNTSTVSAPPSTFRQYRSTESPMRAERPSRPSFFTVRQQRPPESPIPASSALENVTPASADSTSSVPESVVSSSSSAANPAESGEARKASGYSFLTPNRSSGSGSVGTESEEIRKGLGYSFSEPE